MRISSSVRKLNWLFGNSITTLAYILVTCISLDSMVQDSYYLYACLKKLRIVLHLVHVLGYIISHHFFLLSSFKYASHFRCLCCSLIGTIYVNFLEQMMQLVLVMFYTYNREACLKEMKPRIAFSAGLW